MIPHLISAALGDYLNLPRAASDSAGQHMAQLRLAKSASCSSAPLTTLLCASHSAKQQSQEGCQVLWIRTVICREPAREKEHF